MFAEVLARLLAETKCMLELYVGIEFCDMRNIAKSLWYPTYQLFMVRFGEFTHVSRGGAHAQRHQCPCA